jgi:hypothetical protein
MPERRWAAGSRASQTYIGFDHLLLAPRHLPAYSTCFGSKHHLWAPTTIASRTSDPHAVNQKHRRPAVYTARRCSPPSVRSVRRSTGTLGHRGAL